MNLVKLIQEQLSGDTLDKFSELLGADPETTGAAASAAVPTLMSGLANLASSADGVKTLSGILGSFDTNGLGNIANMFGGDSSSLLNKGNGLLNSLFGEGMTATAASAISKFAGLNPGVVKSLLAMLMPMVLGKVASQWKNNGGTASALTNLMAEQKRYVADAAPAGFSLDSIPGFGSAKDAVTQTTRRTAETAEHATASMASWILPLAALLVCGFLLWNFMRARPDVQPVAKTDTATSTSEKVTVMKPELPDMPAVPTVARMTDELNATFKELGETFSSIKDAASAEAAAPKLEQLSAKIDALKAMMSKLPESARTTLNTIAEDGLKPIKEQTQQALNLPGLSDRIKTLIGQIVQKLEEWNIIERTS